MFSVLNHSTLAWADKTNLAFFRGRDSREQRIELVKLSRKYPDLIDARLTNVFFFRDKMDEIGELAERVSFFDFFKVGICPLMAVFSYVKSEFGPFKVGIWPL